MLDHYTVTDLTTYIRELFEVDFRLQDVWVEGEISNMRQAPSGHWYFTLKDRNAQLKGVMWRSSAEQQSIIPRDGDAVLAHGRVGVYDVQGVYQLYADQIRPVGMGNLYQQFEQLKARLDAEGLFDPARKRPIPSFPHQIGVVTSASAAAFQDIQNVLRRRFPVAEVILSSTLVQGDEAPPQIVAALERLNDYTQVDVILLCRGGGSMEDLWAFNDERVARAVAASRIPVISGVGHEIDFTIVDFVSDLRAPTPSAAAELATPNIDDLRSSVRDLDQYMTTLITDSLAGMRSDLNMRQRTLGHLSPANTIHNMRQRIDDWNMRLVNRQQGMVRLWRERLASRLAALQAADPRSILARGYAIVSRSEDGSRIESAGGIKPGTGITIQFHDDELKARVEDKDSHERYKRTLF
ncbi:MAG: exodeoxyribonuclease VII large subunit [Anaerolineae bacterium]|nr:exodeoxyribonuclease VII large subunit [Anaerolineae bacterium]